MSQTQLNVLFKKIQKDDKKEVLEFHVQGDELPNSEQLVGMAGSIVFLNVETSKAGKINTESKSIQRDSKKTTLKFNVKGDSEEKMNKLYRLLAEVFLTFWKLHKRPLKILINRMKELSTQSRKMVQQRLLPIKCLWKM
ncbi:hypothetical protein ACIQZI_12800 [Peribacillus sp. NPDC096379]|uniref:hypothetical protein n=1 Tax=Peribacillus sp. NPDC096379 TaxID=3364393 RepID=UPI0037F36F7F